MHITEILEAAGFRRFMMLDAAECGLSAPWQTLLLAIWPYEAEREPSAVGGWVHPYYHISQQAYQAAAAAVRTVNENEQIAQHCPDLRLKPIFARQPGCSQGRNTLTYLPDYGSRFHVQAIALKEACPIVLHLEDAPHALHCGDCTACMQACPTGAITPDGFVRERCIRSWQLTGKTAPEDICAAMGNRFLGCDECQRCCPHNPPPTGETQPVLDIEAILADSKCEANKLSEMLGANLALPNRLLAQACITAAWLGKTDLLEPLQDHPSPLVAAHAAWGLQLKK